MINNLSNATQLQEKWKPVLDFDGLDPIKDPHRRSVTAILLENQENAIAEQRMAEGHTFGLLSEATVDTGSSGGNAGFGGSDAANTAKRAGYDPILISLVRRSAPNLIAYDLIGVQPLSGPTGLVFYMKSNYVENDDGVEGIEALFGEADTLHSAVADATSTPGGTDNDASAPNADPFDVAGDGTGYLDDTTAAANTDVIEDAGQGTADHFREMTFGIEKTSVTAKSRALKAEYTTELAQDLKAIHGLEAEGELANILSSETLAEINREVIRTVVINARQGAQDNVTTAGTFDLSVDSNGRWSVEKFKGLHFQLEREANAIATATRRGRGNWILGSADAIAALSMTGNLETGAPTGGGQLSNDGIVGNTFVGTLNGRFNVYVDPYFAHGQTAPASHEYICVGYKGTSPYDAGMFYCPNVPLQMVRATGENTFQPKIGFKTRYGIIANPFTQATAATNATNGTNDYYRKIKITNVM